MSALDALYGAAGAIGVRELAEWRLRVKQRRADCPHPEADSFITTFGGYSTRHCRRCGWQELIRPSP